MYRHCLHCHADLGANESLESFPVGKRLAFDSLKGRLWVVCAKCERWNLSPFESRWEALEQAERLFRATRVRYSTDNIGLTKTPEGTTLIRVGRPLRPEFAAWRYGDQFGRRRRRNLITGGAITTGLILAGSGVLSLGIGVVGLLPLYQVYGAIAFSRAMHNGSSIVRHPDGGWIKTLGSPKLVSVAESQGKWGIEMGWISRLESPKMNFKAWINNGNNMVQGTVILTGDSARHALARSMPSVNSAGAPKARIKEAVTLLDSQGGPEQFMDWAIQQRSAWNKKQFWGDNGDLSQIPQEARLAIEMAVHESNEQAVLQGELAELEKAWLDAEEIAAISDRLLVPDEINSQLKQMKLESDRDSSNGSHKSSDGSSIQA